MKLCPKCQLKKDRSEFNKCAGRKDGIQPYCRQCFITVKSEFYRANKAKLLDNCVQYYKANKESCNTRNEAYYYANKEKVQARQLIWAKSHPELLKLYRSNRRALKRIAPGTHTTDDIKQLFKLQRGKCPVCNASLSNGYHCDHIKALSKGGSNYRSNIQLLCKTCNLSKGAKDVIQFMQSRGMLL